MTYTIAQLNNVSSSPYCGYYVDIKEVYDALTSSKYLDRYNRCGDYDIDLEDFQDNVKLIAEAHGGSIQVWDNAAGETVNFVEHFSDCGQLHILVADNVDMDGTFLAVCLDTSELIEVNGWVSSFYRKS